MKITAAQNRRQNFFILLYFAYNNFLAQLTHYTKVHMDVFSVCYDKKKNIVFTYL